MKNLCEKGFFLSVLALAKKVVHFWQNILHFSIRMVWFHTNDGISAWPAACLQLACSVHRAIKVHFKVIEVTYSPYKLFDGRKNILKQISKIGSTLPWNLWGSGTLILASYKSWLLVYLRGCMKSLHLELALYGSNSKCTRTIAVLQPISEVSTWGVSLIRSLALMVWAWRCSEDFEEKDELVY